jgi:hypothetical protein
MDVYLRVMWRFRWLVLLGAVVAVATPFPLLYHIHPLLHGRLVARSKASYVASTELIVNNPTGPYLRTQLSTQGATPPSHAATKQSQATATTATAQASARSAQQTSPGVATNTHQLIDAANLFPLFIGSDAVSRLREQLAGRIPGAVTAKALYSLEQPNKYRPSSLPIIQILATSGKPAKAVKLANSTARAFNLWLVRKQNAAHVPFDQRIIVRPLTVATTAAETGGPSYSLPLIAAFAVFAAFCGLAVAADRRRPRVAQLYSADGAPDPRWPDAAVRPETPDAATAVTGPSTTG